MAGFSSSPALWPYGLGAPVVTLAGFASPVAPWPYALGVPVAAGPFNVSQTANVGLAGSFTLGGDVGNNAPGAPFAFEPPLALSVSGALSLTGNIAFGASLGSGFRSAVWLSAVGAPSTTLNLTPTGGIGLSGALALAGNLAFAAITATIGRPASDASNSGWSASTGTDLFAMVDETTPDPADYIVATSLGAVCELALGATSYPGTASQVLKFRASSSTGNSVIVRLKNTGGATVRSATQLLTAVDTEYGITLTAGEIAAITSGALSVQLESA